MSKTHRNYPIVEFSQTKRGFTFYTFFDDYDQECSLQKSSAACYDAVWPGIDVNYNGERVNARMHLTQAQASWLAEQLRKFAESGEVQS